LFRLNKRYYPIDIFYLNLTIQYIIIKFFQYFT